MKNNKLIIFLIILLSVIAVGVIVFMTNLIKGNFNFINIKTSYKVSNKLIYDETFTNPIENVVIEADTSDIYIKESKDESVRVVIYGDEDKTTVDTINNKLNIKSASKKCIGFCFNQIAAKIEVYLPQDYQNNINISNKYGDIIVGSLAMANFDITADCGDVKMIKSNEVTITNHYGDIEVGYANKATIKGDAGDISIDEVKVLKAKNNYGDIEIGRVMEYLDIEDDCGDVSIDSANLLRDSKIDNDFGDIEIGRTNKLFIESKTSLGEVSVNNSYRDSEVTLTINNSCGDIIVNN